MDAVGATVARLGAEQGVLIAEVAIGRQPATEKIPEDFWLPEMPESVRRRWAATGAAGRDFYLKETRAKLAR